MKAHPMSKAKRETIAVTVLVEILHDGANRADVMRKAMDHMTDRCPTCKPARRS